MLIDFTITLYDGRKPMAVRVKVHDSVAALQGAARRYNLDRDTDEDISNAAGICQRRHMAGEDLVAIVRLAPPYLNPEILAHEMAHAAVWLWEIQNKFSRKVPLTCTNDEWFCLVLGKLVHHATATLIEKGLL